MRPRIKRMSGIEILSFKKYRNSGMGFMFNADSNKLKRQGAILCMARATSTDVITVYELQSNKETNG